VKEGDASRSDREVFYLPSSIEDMDLDSLEMLSVAVVAFAISPMRRALGSLLRRVTAHVARSRPAKPALLCRRPATLA
jgi:hypothetical protein